MEVGKQVDVKQDENRSKERNEECKWNDREGSDEMEVERGEGGLERATAEGGGAEMERGKEG